MKTSCISGDQDLLSCWTILRAVGKENLNIIVGGIEPTNYCDKEFLRVAGEKREPLQGKINHYPGKPR